jgi:hypothetical protein
MVISTPFYGLDKYFYYNQKINLLKIKNNANGVFKLGKL